MNFEKMCEVEPELLRLEASASVAGRHDATWQAYVAASHEALSKLAGRGAAHEELQSAACYEAARAALFAAWSRGSKAQPMPEPDPPPFRDGEQVTMFNTVELYQ